jgi:hypothetical protein
MRVSTLLFSVSTVLSLLACGGLGGEPPVEAPVVTGVTLAAFAPQVGERFAVTSSLDLDLNIEGEDASRHIKLVESAEGEVTVRTVTNGRLAEVNVRVTGGKTLSESPEGRTESLPDAVGRDYVVERGAGSDEHAVRTAAGEPVSDAEEAELVRVLADEVFSERSDALLVNVGETVDIAQLFTAMDDDETIAGTLTLGVAAGGCGAPFDGSFSMSGTDDGMNISMSMTGSLCVDAASGAVSRADFSGPAKLANADVKGSGTARISSTVARR